MNPRLPPWAIFFRASGAENCASQKGCKGAVEENQETAAGDWELKSKETLAISFQAPCQAIATG
jgi:hypothetical protein